MTPDHRALATSRNAKTRRTLRAVGDRLREQDRAGAVCIHGLVLAAVAPMAGPEGARRVPLAPLETDGPPDPYQRSDDAEVRR